MRDASWSHIHSLYQPTDQPMGLARGTKTPRAFLAAALVCMLAVGCSEKGDATDDATGTTSGPADDADMALDASAPSSDDSVTDDDAETTDSSGADTSGSDSAGSTEAPDRDDGASGTDDETNPSADDVANMQPDIADEPPVSSDDSPVDQLPDDEPDATDDGVDDAESPLDDDLDVNDTPDDTADDTAGDDTTDDDTNVDDLAPIDPGVWEATNVDLDPAPSPGNSWNLPTADSLNATPAALARFGNSIVLAGARPPEGADDPNVSEAFVTRLDNSGAELWSTVLPDSGFPHDIIANETTGEILVMTPYAPDSTFLNPSSYNDQTMLIRLDQGGNIIESVTRDIAENGDIIMGMAMDAEGSVFITGAGGASPPKPFLAKFDASFDEQWVTIFDHSGSQGWAPAVTVLADGDVAITGYFDATINFGGDTLTSLGMSGQFSMPNGFVARFTSNGDHVFSQRFGGPIFDGGTSIVSLGDDMIVGGSLSGMVEVGGMSVEVSDDGAAFVARLDPTGTAKWVEVIDGGLAQQIAVHEPSGNLYVVGNFDDRGILMNFDVDGQLLGSVGAVDGEVNTYDVTLDLGLDLWITGTYSGSVDFGNDNLLTSDRPGVFLVRLLQSIAL